MKPEDFDEDFNFKRKRTSDILFILKIIGIMLIVFIIFSFSLSIKKLGGSDLEIEEKGEKYGKSWFIKYQGKISVPIPSGGRYFLENVDINSFRALDSQDRSTLMVGMDKNHVYCGNISLPDLNPGKLEIIGNGYYTDGTNTYFCSPNPERNEKLPDIMEFLQSLVYSYLNTKRPQSYIYPYTKIENEKKLQAVKDLYLAATDGEKVYYKGKVLENADLKTLKRVDMYTEYLADKENVYYKSKLLPIKNNGRLKVVSLEQGEKFLYDEINGYVFKEDYFFDREKSPYKALGNKGNHMYNMIFVNNEGIYYYDNQEDKLKRAGDNIFIGKLEEVTPNIFTDDENIYYFNGHEVRERYKKTSRNTEIYYLDKKVNWKKVTDIGDGIYGSIWQKGDKHYYFDNLGIDSTIQDTIYEIADKETLEYLLNNSGNTDKIKEFIENGKLIQTIGEKKVEIAVEDKKMPDNEKMWFLAALTVVFVVVIILRIKENQ